jgi:hypothetical protein
MSNCIFCGATEATEQVKFPDTFTAYQMLQAGDKACKRCFEMFKNPKFRRNNWFLANIDGIDIVTTFTDALSFLQDMPKPPYMLYVTKQKRKHGWINAVQNPVLNTERFILCVDEEKIFFNRPKFNELIAFLNQLWGRGINKCTMLGGYPSVGIIRKFGLTREECQQLETLQGDRLWQFVVAFKKHAEEKENE